jgi:hypothetical protein
MYGLPEYTLISDFPWYLGDDENYIYWPYEQKEIIELSYNVFIIEYELVGEIVLYLRVKYVPVDFP